MKRLYLPLLLFALVRLSAQGQEVPTYTLKSCLEQGIEKNYSLRMVRNEEQVSKNNATLANAGALPQANLTGSYNGSLEDTETEARATGTVSKAQAVFDQGLNAGANASWTLFDGFRITANYQTLKELERQGVTNTRMAVEDLIADIAVEYYNFLQQKIRLKNFRYAVSLSKERLRIVEERYHIGSFSRLDYQQAKVDFNADSAQYMKQQELLHSSRIQLNELIANENVDQPVRISDTVITVNSTLHFEELWEATLRVNARLLKAGQNETIAQWEWKKVASRDYPYLKLNAGYGYSVNLYGKATNRRSSTLGPSFGASVGFKLFDGNRKRERANARLTLENAQLEREQLELSLKATLSNLWQAYQNNLQMLNLEQQNLIAATDNHDIAMERYLLGDLSGIEMREAQKSLLDAEERLLAAEYTLKVCEISLLQISGNITDYLE